MTEQSIYDPHADIRAVGLYFDTDVQSWRLRAVGMADECVREIGELSKRRPEFETRIYEVDQR